MLSIAKVENLAPSYEPSVVKRLAKELGATEGESSTWKWALGFVALGAAALIVWRTRVKESYRRGVPAHYRYAAAGRRAYQR